MLEKSQFLYFIVSCVSCKMLLENISNYIYYFFLKNVGGALGITKDLSQEEKKEFEDLEDTYAEFLPFYTLWEKLMEHKNMQKYIPEHIIALFDGSKNLHRLYHHSNQESKERIFITLKNIFVVHVLLNTEPDSDLVSELAQLANKFELETFQVVHSILYPGLFNRMNAHSFYDFEDLNKKSDEVAAVFENAWFQAQNKFFRNFQDELQNDLPMFRTFSTIVCAENFE